MKSLDEFDQETIDAIEVLTGKGFELFTEVKFEDVRDLTGSRRRTFSHAGRYDIVIAMRKVIPRGDISPEGETSGAEVEATVAVDDEADAEIELPAVRDMSRAELLAAVKKIDGVSNPTRMKTTLLVRVLRAYRAGRFNPKTFKFN